MDEFSAFLQVVAWLSGGAFLILGIAMLLLGNSIVQDKKRSGLVKISFFRACYYASLSRKKWHARAHELYGAFSYLRYGEVSILVSLSIIILSALL